MFSKEDENHKHPLKLVFKGAMTLAFIMLAVFLFLLSRNTVRSYHYIGRQPVETHTVAVSGVGKVTSAPDLARLNLGVTSEAKTVSSAQKDNTDKMNKIIAAIKDMGVKSEDIKTVSYNVYPKYDYNRNTGESTIVGYTVSQSLDVKVRALDKVGDVLAKAGELGANQVGGISFTIDDPESLKAEARKKAFDDAKKKADTLFGSLGLKPGRIVGFSEGSSGGPYPIYYDKAVAEFGIGGGASAPQVESGSLDVEVDVSLIFELE